MDRESDKSRGEQCGRGRWLCESGAVWGRKCEKRDKYGDDMIVELVRCVVLECCPRDEARIPGHLADCVCHERILAKPREDYQPQ